MQVVNALIEGVTQDIIAYLVEDRRIEVEDAMKIFYRSIVCEKLLNKDTGLYKESSAYLYELLKDELADGEFIQKEI
ncbi:MAG: hypothetical protein PHE82_10345 [Syntrophomonadaceae bacterium]|nr:hypothetical protein [Syntrophomonadaceae bacterium]